MDFLNDLEPLLKSLWCIALPTSLIFVIQSILTFVGLDSSDGIDADFDSDLSGTDAPFQLFSFRNLINFLLGFSWGGISFYQYIENPLALVAISSVIGLLFVGFFFLIIKQLMKLSEDNSFTTEKALFKTGNVYLRIPANKSGSGIVQISVNGSLRELKAITPANEIETGSLIKVVDITNDLLVVEKI